VVDDDRGAIGHGADGLVGVVAFLDEHEVNLVAGKDDGLARLDQFGVVGKAGLDLIEINLGHFVVLNESQYRVKCPLVRHGDGTRSL
jgi:hypothetical protein